MLELCGLRGNPSLPSHPGPLLAGVVAPDRFLSMGKIELVDIYTEYKQIELFEIEQFDNLIVCK